MNTPVLRNLMQKSSNRIINKPFPIQSPKFAENQIIMSDPNSRNNIKPGILVNIILKKDQRSGNLTEGIVKDILTSAPYHSRGIKVRLTDGQIGRVAEIIDED